MTYDTPTEELRQRKDWERGLTEPSLEEQLCAILDLDEFPEGWEVTDLDEARDGSVTAYIEYPGQTVVDWISIHIDDAAPGPGAVFTVAGTGLADPYDDFLDAVRRAEAVIGAAWSLE